MLTERQIAYHQYLKSDHWKCLRASAIDVWGCRCNACESIANIEVHHLNYHNLLDVTPKDLMPLCANCHDDIHASNFMREYLNGKATSEEKRLKTKQYLRDLFFAKKRAENRSSHPVERNQQESKLALVTEQNCRKIIYCSDSIHWMKQNGINAKIGGWKYRCVGLMIPAMWIKGYLKKQHKRALRSAR